MNAIAQTAHAYLTILATTEVAPGRGAAIALTVALLVLAITRLAAAPRRQGRPVRER